MSSERHLREARELLDHVGPVGMAHAIAAALREAELRGVRAGLAAAVARLGAMPRNGSASSAMALDIAENAVEAIDPASVEVEP